MQNGYNTGVFQRSTVANFITAHPANHINNSDLAVHVVVGGTHCRVFGDCLCAEVAELTAVAGVVYHGGMVVDPMMTTGRIAGS